MPPKRRTSTPTTATAGAGRRRTQQQQATLSFHGSRNQKNRITKPSSATNAHSTKKSKQDPALFDLLPVGDAEPELDAPTTAEVAVQEQALGVKATGAGNGRVKKEKEKEKEGAGDEMEQRARKIGEAQIARYWRAKESERKAPRVHQEGLGVGEKVLREWDVSGVYGPCIGIARLKRWKRAHTLGLDPPIEVLAVLLRQMDQGDLKGQRAHVDELMSSRFIET